MPVKHVAICLLLLAAGCVGRTSYSYTKPDASAEATARATAGCRAESNKITNQSPEHVRAYIDDCMRAQGYRHTS